MTAAPAPGGLLIGVFTGPAAPLLRAGWPDVASGIVKSPRAQPVRLTFAGLAGDEQGDPVYHGGPEKAVHHYAAEHYPWWRARWPDSPVALAPGAFGENVSTTGMTEHTVCIGDIYRAGTALLQVSQGRQPCWRLNRRFARADAAAAMQASGRTGWYYRVLEEGALAPGATFALVERPCPDWPLARLIAALFPADRFEPDVAPAVVTGRAPALAPNPAAALADEWRRAAALAPLASNWRATFARRVDTGRVEDWARRLAE